jgi:hypothetical protein
MKRILTTLTATAAVLGVAVMAPTQASAFFVAPAIAALAIGGGVVGGAVVGSALTNPHPRGSIVVTDASTAPEPPLAPAAQPGCYPSTAKIQGVWHHIQVCD